MIRKNQKNLDPPEAPSQDKRLGRMVLFSGLLHVGLLLVLVSAADPPQSKPWTAQSYTVSLVAPAALGPAPEPPPTLSPKKKVESVAVTPLPKPKPLPPKVETKKPKVETKKPKVETKKPKVETKKPKVETKKPKVETKKPKKSEKKLKIAKPEKKKSVKIASKKNPPKKNPPPEKKKSPAKMEVKKPRAKSPSLQPSPPKEPEEQGLSAEDRERQIVAALKKVRQRVQADPRQTAQTHPPTSASGRGGGGDTLRGLPFILYTQQVKQRVKQSWIVAEPKSGLTAVVRFGILANGEIVGVELAERSGDSIFDESAMRAVRKASPLPPPPEAYRNEFTRQKVEVVFGETRRVQSQRVRSE